MAVATNPISGSVDPLRYSITLCALAKYWIDKYMPDMGYQDGYSNYEMSTKAAQTAFTHSGLEQNLDKARDGQNERITFLRQVVDNIITDMGLTPSALHLPKHPHTSPHFLDSVMLNIYEGDPKIEWELKSDEAVDNKKHKPLHNVLEHIFAVEGYKEAIEGSLKSSISNLFIQAPSLVNPRLLRTYDCLPTGLRTAFGSCSLHGGGGALTHLVVCGGLNSVIGGFSGVFMNAAMWGIAPAVALATTYAEEKYRYNDFNPYKYILPVAISLGVAFGASRFLPHEHSTDSKLQWFYGANMIERHKLLEQQTIRFNKLSPDLKRDLVDRSGEQKMTKEMFLLFLDTCGGDLTPKIMAYEREQASKVPSHVLQ